MKGEKYVFIKEIIVVFKIRVETIHDWNSCIVSLVSVFNLIPPRVIGKLSIPSTLRPSQHRLYYGTYCSCSFQRYAMYGLRFMYGGSLSLGLQTRWPERLRNQSIRTLPQACLRAFYQKYRSGDLMAHATNDVVLLS